MQRLDLSSIAIRTFYGHPLPGVAAQDIGPGVNVIYGPNGQGKTTLARAIHGVLWPETVEAARPTYTASFHYGGDAWDVHFDSGSPRYHCNGEPADRLPLPDPSYRDRYELSLSDLLVEDGESFADLVRRDAAGGVDLGEARQRLGLIAAPTQRLKATAEAEDAARSVQRRQHALDALRAREQALGEIAERAAEATDATELAELYRLLDDAADREDEVRAAESVVAEFDPALASVAPDTQERYDDLSAAVRKAESRLEDAEASRASARAALADHGWDDVAIPEAAELRARHAELETATRVVEAAESARSTASEREDRARLALGGHIDIAPTVDISALGDVAAFARRAGQVEGRAVEYQARRDAAKARLNAIRFHDADELSRAADLLRQWLAHTSEAERRPVLLAPTPVWVAVGVCAVLGVVGLFLGRLGSGWMYAGMAALGAAFALVPVAIRLGRDVEPPASPADAAREQFGVLAVLGPETWDAPTVQRTLDRVERQLLDQKERTLWKDSVEENERMLLTVEQDREALADETIRISRELGLEAPTSPEQLHLLSRTMLAWQESARDLGVADATRDQARDELAAALDLFNHLLDGVPAVPVADAAEAAGLVARIAREEDERARLRAEVRRLDTAAGVAAEALEEVSRARDAFLQRIGLEEPAADGVAGLVATYPAYLAAVEDAARSRTLAEEAASRARAHARFTPEADALDRAALAERRTAAEMRAARRDEWLEERASIQTLVGEARRASALATAHAEHARALDALEVSYDEQADALVGHALATFVEEETRDQHLPQVFKRAREILSDITDDRFRLDFAAEEGSFTAFDTVRGRTFGLDELSSGTRLQLLLAVRLAFAEGQEVGVRLPLLLDEALANSDDERAGAIVEAVLRLCRQGRQVFYFTAQTEEVAKWHRLAEDHPDVECRFVGLPNQDALASVDLDATPAEISTRHVPEPAGESLEAYADAVGVPAWSGWDVLDALHLWYLLDYAQDLYACLRRGYTTWGQLRAAGERGKPLPVEVARVRQRAEAVAAWQKAWRQGRGRPVTQDAVEALSSVDPELRPELVDLARRVEGDALAFVLRLREGDVEGVEPRQVTQIEHDLVEGRFLSPDPSLDESDIRRRVVEAVPHPDALDDALDVLARIRQRAEAVAG